MAKREKERCRHGNSPVYMQGCGYCVRAAMLAFEILRDNGWTADELWALLHVAFPSKQALDEAVVKARAKVEEWKVQRAVLSVSPEAKS